MTAATVYVHTWFPEPIPSRATQQPVDDGDDRTVTRLWSGSIRIWGRLHQKNSTHGWWRSSSIVRLLSPTTFVTRHGTIVSIVGPMYTPYARKFNLSDQILSAFRNGLPKDWDSQLCREPHPFFSASPYALGHALRQLDQESMFALPAINSTENKPVSPCPPPDVDTSPNRVSVPKIRSCRLNRRVSFSEPVAVVSQRPARTRRNSVPQVSMSPADVPSSIQDDAGCKLPPGPLSSMRRSKPKSLLRSLSLEPSPRKTRVPLRKLVVSPCPNHSGSDSPQLKPEQEIIIQPNSSKPGKKNTQRAIQRKVYPRRAASIATKSKIKEMVTPRISKMPSRRRTSTRNATKMAPSKPKIPALEVPDNKETLNKRASDPKPPETQIGDNAAVTGKEDGQADLYEGAILGRKRVAFATSLPGPDPSSRPVSKSPNGTEQSGNPEEAAEEWSREQREAFQRQRNQIAANLPDYWDRVAAGVPEKSADDCRFLWLSNWTSPLPNVPPRKKRRVATPEVVMHVRKASKQKHSRETAIYRSNVRRLAEVVARDVNDAALEPHIVTPTSLPGAKQLLELAADDDGDGGCVMVDGTPGSEIRQKRAAIAKKGELVTPEILARGKKMGFMESDHYVTLFKKRIGSAALCMPITSEDSKTKIPARSAMSSAERAGILGKRSRIENMSDYDSKDTNDTLDFGDEYDSNDESG